MSTSSANGNEKILLDVRQRLTPTLCADSESAPLLTLKHSPSTGYGVFSSQSIAANTQLLQSDGPAVYVIYRVFRKEVCAWCFRYDQGRNWKIRFASEDGNGNGNGNGRGSGVVAGIFFCSEQCRDAWRGEYGDVGVEAFASVEGLVLKQAKNKGWTIEPYPENDDYLKVPNDEDIEKAWTAAEEQANLILPLRLGSPQSASPPEPFDLEDSISPTSRPKHSTKLQKQAFAKAVALPVLNTDTLFFLLNGILCASSSTKSKSPWRTLLTLNPSLYARYPNFDTLRQVTSTFLHLVAVLPPSLLPVVTRETVEGILARDIGNSFGIWSTDNDPGNGSNTPDLQRMDEDQDSAEMLGYGIWPIASFFNHSCVPNVSRRRIDRRWIFSSARDVIEDEELCISYIRGEEDALKLDERRRRLKDGWGFTCRCAKCLHEDESQPT